MAKKKSAQQSQNLEKVRVRKHVTRANETIEQRSERLRKQSV